MAHGERLKHLLTFSWVWHTGLSLSPPLGVPIGHTCHARHLDDSEVLQDQAGVEVATGGECGVHGGGWVGRGRGGYGNSHGAELSGCTAITVTDHQSLCRQYLTEVHLHARVESWVGLAFSLLKSQEGFKNWGDTSINAFQLQPIH